MFIVNDWFIGQWQWLIGFAYWNVMLCPLCSPYLDVYDYAEAWWADCVLILAIYIGIMLYYTSKNSQPMSHLVTIPGSYPKARPSPNPNPDLDP